MITIKLKHTVFFICVVAFAILVVSCNSVYTPKKKGYFKIDLPQHAYQKFDRPGYPYTFEYPTYANVVQDSTYFEEQPENPYWINVDVPRFNAKVYISYNEIGGKARYKVRTKDGRYVDSIGVNKFVDLMEGSYKLTFKHSLKATSIDDSVFVTPNGVNGIWFRIGGNAATASQFLVSDSVKHFLRGALYFDAPPNEDSLSVVNQFLQEDVRHLINTLKWR